MPYHLFSLYFTLEIPVCYPLLGTGLTQLGSFFCWPFLEWGTRRRRISFLCVQVYLNVRIWAGLCLCFSCWYLWLFSSTLMSIGSCGHKHLSHKETHPSISDTLGWVGNSTCLRDIGACVDTDPGTHARLSKQVYLSKKFKAKALSFESLYNTLCQNVSSAHDTLC